MIAVTFALPNESSEFARRLRNGKLHGKELRIWHTGVGEKTTRARLEKFLAQETPELLISSGFAGAITNELEVGDVFLAENFSTAMQAGALEDFNRGALATVHGVVDSGEEREALARKQGASAVDMETEFIAQICAQFSVPMLSLRVISDSPAQPFPIPPRILFNVARQKTEYTRLAFYLLTHPRALPRLLAFAKRIKGASGKLADALKSVVRAL